MIATENLEDIARWTSRLAEITSADGTTSLVGEALSLTTVTTIHGVDDGIDVSPLVADPIPSEPSELAELEHLAQTDPDIGGRLLSQDGRSTAIFATYRDLENQQELELGQAMWRIAHEIEAERPDVKAYPTGQPAFLEVFRSLTMREMVTLYPAVVLAMIALLWLSFRDIRAVIIPFVVIVLACVWTVGMLALAGRYLNSTTVVIPAVVILISVADTVHIVNQYFETVRRARAAGEELERRALMKRTLDRVLMPCVLTTVTTVVVFCP